MSPAKRSSLWGLTGTVIRACHEVYRKLGPGLSEKVYARALRVQLSGIGIRSESEKEFAVALDGKKVGAIRADLDVQRRVVMELKASKDGMGAAAIRQMSAALCVSRRPVGLLVNFFGRTPEVRRFDRGRGGRATA